MMKSKMMKAVVLVFLLSVNALALNPGDEREGVPQYYWLTSWTKLGGSGGNIVSFRLDGEPGFWFYFSLAETAESKAYLSTLMTAITTGSKIRVIVGANNWNVGGNPYRETAQMRFSSN